MLVQENVGDLLAPSLSLVKGPCWHTYLRIPQSLKGMGFSGISHEDDLSQRHYLVLQETSLSLGLVLWTCVFESSGLLRLYPGLLASSYFNRKYLRRKISEFYLWDRSLHGFDPLFISFLISLSLLSNFYFKCANKFSLVWDPTMEGSIP